MSYPATTDLTNLPCSATPARHLASPLKQAAYHLLLPYKATQHKVFERVGNLEWHLVQPEVPAFLVGWFLLPEPYL